jgi:hypothetical protein
MANLLNFRFGKYEGLPKDLSAGTVYVTTDEKAMYVDLPNKDKNDEVERFRLGTIIVKESVKDAKPPFADGAIYYFVEGNALLRWKKTGADTGEWT